MSADSVTSISKYGLYRLLLPWNSRQEKQFL